MLKARFGKAGRPHGEQLQGVGRIANLAEVRRPERMDLRYRSRPGTRSGGLGIEIFRVGLPGEHPDVVPGGRPIPGSDGECRRLAAAMGLAAIGQQRDSHAREVIVG